MGFFSFGKKKKADNPSPPAPATTRISKDKKPAKLVNSASASSTLSNASSGSSSYSPPRTSQQQQAPIARRTNTSPAAHNNGHYRHSSALAPPPPIPALPAHGRLSGSSSTSNLRPSAHNPTNLSSSNTSLALPNAPYASGNNSLAKKGSSATLNSMHSAGGTPLKRGPHDPPARAIGLGSASSGSFGSLNNPFNKQRAASYGYGVRNIWTTGTGPRSMDGHQYGGTHPAVFAGKHASTGSPGMLVNGSSYINTHNAHHVLATDDEFKAYTRQYDVTIAKAHTLAREYHHLPPAKRDQAGFERIGYAFAAAAIISREHWNMRCALEKERLEALLSRRKKGEVVDLDAADWEEPSPHRVAGLRACEGWQYASMLADAWGVKDEMATPLEEMPVLKPKYASTTFDGYGQNTASWYGDSGASYMHPGHSPAAYAAYIAQQQQHPPVATTRGRYDSTASRASRASRAPSFSESVQMALNEGRERAISLSSSHTHSVLSHMPNGYTAPSNHGHGSNHGHAGYVPSRLNHSTPGLAMMADEHGMKPYVESSSHEYITPSVREQLSRSRANSEVVEKVEERQPIVLKRGIKFRNGSLSGRSVEGVAVAVA